MTAAQGQASQPTPRPADGASREAWAPPGPGRQARQAAGPCHSLRPVAQVHTSGTGSWSAGRVAWSRGHRAAPTDASSALPPAGTVEAPAQWPYLLTRKARDKGGEMEGTEGPRRRGAGRDSGTRVARAGRELPRGHPAPTGSREGPGPPSAASVRGPGRACQAVPTAGGGPPPGHTQELTRPHPRQPSPPAPATRGPSPSPGNGRTLRRLQAQTCPGLPTVGPAGPRPTRPPNCCPLLPSGEAEASGQDRCWATLQRSSQPPALPATGLHARPQGTPAGPPWSPAPDAHSCQWERRPAPREGGGPRPPGPGEGRVCAQAAPSSLAGPAAHCHGLGSLLPSPDLGRCLECHLNRGEGTRP